MILDHADCPPVTTYQRRYDVDWLRIAALTLLVFYHVTIAFQEWAADIGFPVSKETLPGLWTAVSAVNIWRIPLLFIISGMGVRFAMERRDWRALLKDRTVRILLPFVFGYLVVGPLGVTLLGAWFYRTPFSYVPISAHLWFLGNIFGYVLVLSPILYYLKNRPSNWIFRSLGRAMRLPAGVFLVSLPLMLESMLVDAAGWEYYANTLHGAILGLICFVLGFLLASVMKMFFPAAQKMRWPALGFAVALYLARVFVLGLTGQRTLTAFEATCWMLALFGFASLHLNKPSPILNYLGKAVFPAYIVHLPVQFALSYLVFKVPTSGHVQLMLLVLGTYGISLLLYEIVLKRIPWVRVLFGIHPATGRPDKTQTPSGSANAP